MGPSLDDLVRDAEEEQRNSQDAKAAAALRVGPLPADGACTPRSLPFSSFHVFASNPHARKPEVVRGHFIVTPAFALDGEDRRKEPDKKKRVRSSASVLTTFRPLVDAAAQRQNRGKPNPTEEGEKNKTEPQRASVDVESAANMAKYNVPCSPRFPIS